MIKTHLRAISNLFETIDDLEETIKTMPEGRDKYKLEAELTLLRRTAEEYADNTTTMYDGMLNFAMAAAR